MFKSVGDKLYSKWMDSLGFTQETFLHYFQTLCRVVSVTWFWAIIYRWTCQNHYLYWGRGSRSSQECSSVLLLNVLLRM